MIKNKIVHTELYIYIYTSEGAYRRYGHFSLSQVSYRNYILIFYFILDFINSQDVRLDFYLGLPKKT